MFTNKQRTVSKGMYYAGVRWALCC